MKKIVNKLLVYEVSVNKVGDNNVIGIISLRGDATPSAREIIFRTAIPFLEYMESTIDYDLFLNISVYNEETDVQYGVFNGAGPPAEICHSLWEEMELIDNLSKSPVEPKSGEIKSGKAAKNKPQAKSIDSHRIGFEYSNRY